VTIIVADTCALINFAAVDEMGLLQTALRERARWTQAVAQEIGRSVQYYPALKPLIDDRWLGEPIELSSDNDRLGVGRLRTALGGMPAEPLKHLGEAESIHSILSRSELAGAVLLTEDRDAKYLARMKQVQVWDTTTLLADAHAMGDVEWARASDVISRMDDEGRGVRVPANYQDFA
jgi:predicted nucleic acid-binding protein